MHVIDLLYLIEYILESRRLPIRPAFFDVKETWAALLKFLLPDIGVPLKDIQGVE